MSPVARNIVITGGSRGIGRATALLAGQRGWSVAVNYRSNLAMAEQTVADTIAAGGQAIAIQGDIASESSVQGLFDTAEAAFGQLDVVVINAGIVGPSMSLADMTVDRIRHTLDINLFGALLCAREAARRLPRETSRPAGSIVLLSSVAARLGAPFEYVDYAASKGAVDTLTVGLATELAGRNVRVNAVRPGVIDTDIHASGGQPDRARRVGSQVPLGRPGTADEIAEAVIWLASDAASYATGAVLDVAGGR